MKLNKPKVHLIHTVETARRVPLPQTLPALGSLSLAQSYFEEPRWWLSLVLAWIAYREVEAITTSYDDIRTLHFRVVMHGANGDALMEKAPLYNLLKRLKAGRIVAIDGDDTDLPAEYWDRIGYGQPWEAWPHVRFRREHVLENWPKRSNQSERYPGRPTAKPAILEKFRERVAAGTFEKGLAAESQWLFSWVKNEFPGDSTIPSTTRTIENQIRKEHREARVGKHKPR